ncbi:uncharacterized protein SPPG_01348 [Spizellomyces punctatus DAOM BR117]|uniref:RNA polymerase II-associated protein 1 C-terminal domain-containing protein n=1 Tax=Spizellomyces punctatus (strain DAOM BR117) TaxID=645134 RepID=A0A0L0HSP0_SPIPD|nr:uncharacterized protein SPPG_01348 [Spizellomyces punctatus DAOM BR117]KND03894.1 hypothetical protein SPPG_01348 [Spizellomyces punctatus DAOM BR117]|eukprot:XP_016611933.1 hypothetical protein SPPG_01348 [Spizellomyces punctatus DAOM BR117]
MFRGVERPSPQDDEDTLLQLQESFVGGRQPAAKSLRIAGTGKPIKDPAKSARLTTAADNGKKRSIFAERRAREQGAQDVAESKEASEIPRLHREVVSADALFGEVMSDVHERSPDPPSMMAPTGPHPSAGFPTVVHRSQRLKQIRACSTRITESVHQRSHFNEFLSLEGGDESPDIHGQNLQTLQSMSAQEIEEAQAEIREKLDPSLIQMLLQRANQKYGRDESHVEDLVEPPVVSQQPCLGQAREHSSVRSAGGRSELTAPDLSTSMKDNINLRNPKSFIETWIPADKAEHEKLEWIGFMEDDIVDNSAVTNAAELRFDLSGRIIERGTQIPVHRGLHHHGVDPETPGYTLDELLHLSRSTVQAQRAASVRVLGAIIADIYAGAYGKARGIALIWHSLRANVLLHLRFALDDSHETVVTNSLAALAASVGTGSLTDNDEEQCWDQVLLTRLSYRAYAISVSNQADFKSRASGREPSSEKIDHDGSIGSVIQLIRRDAILGLISTDILARFRYLLQSRNLPAEAVNDILQILIRICRHSHAAAVQIAECPGLVDVVHNKFLRGPWPSISKSQSTASLNAVKLLRLLCQSGRDIAESLIRFHIVVDAMKFIMLAPDQLTDSSRELSWYLQAEVWSLLGVLFSYGLCIQLFNDYHSAILSCALKLFGSEVPEASPSTPTAIARSQILLLRMITAFLKSAEGMSDTCPPNHALRPFADLVLKKVLAGQRERNASGNLLHSAAFDMLALYGKQVLADPTDDGFNFIQEATSIMDYIRCTPMPNFSVARSSIEVIANQVPVATPPLGQHLVGLQNKPRTSIATAMLELNAYFEYGCSLMTLCSSFVGIGREWDEFVSEQLSTDQVLGWVTGTAESLDRIAVHSDILRWFLPGRGMLLCSWLLASEILQSHGTVNYSMDGIYGCAVALAALPELLPGEECVASKLLNRFILHPRVQNTLIAMDESLVQVETQELAPQRLQEFLDYGLYDNASLKRSEGLFGREARGLDSLILDEQEGNASLPVRLDWIMSPFGLLLAESKKFGHLLIGAKREQKNREDANDLVAECLALGERVDRIVRPQWYMTRLPDPVKIARLMCIFLLPSSTDEEMFRRTDINKLLSSGLLRYGTRSHRWNDSELDEACGGSGKFFQLYQELVEHYSAVSFGDEVFARYLLLPLAMHYPSDYRELFWDHLRELLHLFTMEKSQLPTADDAAQFYYPYETEERVLLLYASALASGKVTSSSTPFLYDVAVHHLSAALADESPESVGVRFKKRSVQLAASKIAKDILDDIVWRARSDGNGRTVECAK